jgi:hypothetical protein
LASGAPSAGEERARPGSGLLALDPPGARRGDRRPPHRQVPLRGTGDAGEGLHRHPDRDRRPHRVESGARGEDEIKGTFSVGLVRCEDELLNKGANKDSKRTISKAGKKEIRWLVEDGKLPVSLLAELDPEVEAAVFARPPGQARVREFFKRMMRQPVPRDVICTLAMQEDPMRRVRQDRGSAGLDGMKILSGHFKVSKAAAEELGYGTLAKNDYMSVPIDELRTLPPGLRDELEV